ncbi:MAG: Isochorismate synthase MenF [Syntrophus sp. SKADARSKE-3]|nr:Isochorismate synthase MenF [Syntrophus sp. SKADARSKE-3]
MTMLALFKEKIDQWVRHNETKQAPYLVRLETPLFPEVSVLDRIMAFEIAERFYYRAKDEDFIIGGLGSALVMEGDSAADILNGLDRLWEADETVPVFGGFSFFSDEDAAFEWTPFGRFRFTLPLVEIRSGHGDIRIAVQYINKKGYKAAGVARDLRQALESLDAAYRVPPPLMPPAIAKKDLIPGKAEWNNMIKKALQTIKAGDLQKIVLARKKIITHRDLWDPGQIIRAMAEIHENSFTFFYQIEDHIAFLGRSPERLFRMEDSHVQAEAIAGTRPRGKTAQEDERLEGELLNSQKELEEHRFVAGFMVNAMNRICRDVRTVSSEETLKLKNVQHIITRFTGRSPQYQTPLSIAQVFHPTPAVGGYPQEGISGYIKTAEPFGRGWYAAPIGWMNKKNADFAVGIRSALVNRSALHIYAGAGIVRQSNAHAEWNETEEKMDNFAAVLGDV